MTDSKKSIAMVLPYFGGIPPYFPLWVQTASANADVDFFILSDSEAIYEFISSFSNIHMVRMTMQEFKVRAEAVLKCPCSFSYPYKKYEFRPAFGLMFQDLLQNFDFWGHCDFDQIFGSIRSFVTDDILSNFDKIFSWGHFTLYRNTFDVNSLFFQKRKSGKISYPEVFESASQWDFDESGIEEIFLQSGRHVYHNFSAFADVDPFSFSFRTHGASFSGQPFFLQYHDGKLFVVSVANRKIIYRTEVMYAHFQKRVMDDQIPSGVNSDFFVVPNRFISGDAIDDKSCVGFAEKRKPIYALKSKFHLQLTNFQNHIGGSKANLKK